MSSLVGCCLGGLALLGVTLTASGATAQPVNEGETGVRFKGELNLLGPGYALQTTAFQRTVDGEVLDFSQHGALVVVGPAFGLNFGFAPTPKLRFGLRGSAFGAAVIADNDGLAFTGLNALARVTVGPTFGLRLGSRMPWELECGFGFATQVALGGQAEIRAPENGYPLGAVQHGIDALVRAIWRPWGSSSPVGFQAGLDVGWALTHAAATTTQGVHVLPELGVAIGF